MDYRRLITSTLATAGLLVATTGFAATNETSFQVTATVKDSCAIEAEDLAFGEYNPNDGKLESTATITATCTKDTEYDIGLDVGGNDGNADSTTRAMDDGSSNYLDYELYTDSGRNDVWGDTVDTDTVNIIAPGDDKEETVYGRIPADQFVPAGSYSDTINVTITY